MDPDCQIIWTLGKIIICLSVLFCLAANALWVMYEKEGVIFEVLKWPEKIINRIAITYFYLSTSLLLICISKAFVFQAPSLMRFMILHPNMVILSTVALMTILTTILELTPYTKKYTLMKCGAWILHSVAMGPSLAFFGSHICNMAVFSTVLAIISASAVGFIAPKDFYLKLENYISYLYTTVTVSSILCILFNPPVTPIGIFCITLNFFGGMILYFGVFIVNTQYFLNDVKTNDEYDPIYTACVMFLCSLNLYLRIAMYFVVELTNLTDPFSVSSL
ncbi:hypothetical protein AAG570_012149 [Ranatra chinensis]|uniref:Uncharacterized protein n=1 Tax=Ranatra chinensis TaxID=642074 RepID=A0ABD0YHY6_9HEMI